MRITNSITTQKALRTMQHAQRDVARASDRVTSGLRFTRASEDPNAAGQVMRTTGSLRALEQYRRNVDAAAARTSAEESVLDQITLVLTRASEIGIGQATGTATAETRRVAKAEVDQLLRFTVGLGNTRHADAYLFGGAQSAVAPFAVDETDPARLDFTTTSPAGELKVEISAGQLLSTTHDGTQIFGTDSDGVLAVLRDLSHALGADDADAIRTALGGVRTALADTQILIGDVGARMSQLEVTGANLNAVEITLTTFKSDLHEIDFEQAVTELVGRQTAFQAAMLATSKVMGMNLTDYVR